MELETVLAVGTPALERVGGLSTLTDCHATPGEGFLAAMAVCHAGGLHDDRYGFLAAHPDALLHHPDGA